MTPRRFKSYLLLRLLPAGHTTQSTSDHIANPTERQRHDHHDLNHDQVRVHDDATIMPTLILPQLMLLTISGRMEPANTCENLQFAGYVRRFRRHIVTPFLIPGLVASCLLELPEKFCKLSRDLKQMTQMVAEKNHEISIAHFEQSRAIAKLLLIKSPALAYCIYLHRLQQSIISPMPLAHYASLATDDANQMYLKLWRLYKVLVQNVFAKNCDIDLAAFQQNAICSALLATDGKLNRDSGTHVENLSYQCLEARYGGNPLPQSFAIGGKTLNPHQLAGSAPVRLRWDDFDSE